MVPSLDIIYIYIYTLCCLIPFARVSCDRPFSGIVTIQELMRANGKNSGTYCYRSLSLSPKAASNHNRKKLFEPMREKKGKKKLPFIHFSSSSIPMPMMPVPIDAAAVASGGALPPHCLDHTLALAQLAF